MADSSAAGPAADGAVEAAVDVVSERLAGLVRELGTGARLPGERQLAVRLGVSRTALRDRLQVLHALGVLRRVTGSGTYVQELNANAFAHGLDLAITACQLPLDGLHSVRIALERQAAIEAAQARGPGRLDAMGAALTAMGSAETDEGVDEADFAFHFALFRAAGNQALTFFADALAGVLYTGLAQRRAQMRRRLAASGDHRVMADAHQGIYDGVATGDPTAAATAVDQHFQLFDRIVDQPSHTALADAGPSPQEIVSLFPTVRSN